MNKSAIEQRNRRVICSSVSNVVFCEQLSKRVIVARLTPNLRANASWLSLPLRARKFAAKASARSIGRIGPWALVHM